MNDFQARFRAVSAASTTVFWHPPSTPAAMLASLSEFAVEHDIEWDRYGERGAVELLETEVAALLGKPEAVMFPTGIMAQQVALRAWCDRSGSRRVALPDVSHLLHHEQDGPRRVLGLELEHLTTGRQVPTADALAAIGGRLGAVLVELPLRDAGCLLPTWEELTELSAAARERGVALHVDGARIWESAPHWEKSLEEVGALADSIYVSLYKGLAAPAGALVACPEDLAGELRAWRARMGGTVFSLTASAIGGLKGLREELPRMAEYRTWALELAVALNERGFTTFPEQPHIGTFLVYAAGEADTINESVLSFAEEHGIVPGSTWRPADVPGWSVTELACYGSAVVHDPADIADQMVQAVGQPRDPSPRFLP